MGKRIYNWEQLKQEFISGQYRSLKDFAETKGIPYRTVRREGAGWGKLGAEIVAKATEKIIEEAIDSKIKTNFQHIGDLKLLEAFALNGLIDAYTRENGEQDYRIKVPLKNAIEGVDIYLKAMNKEREILGLTKPKPSTTVNVNLQKINTIISDIISDENSRKRIAEKIRELQQAEGIAGIVEPEAKQIENGNTGLVNGENTPAQT